jgi:hypothetical protein
MKQKGATMSTYGTGSARQWVQLIGLGLLLALAVMAVVAVVLPTAALIITLALVATGVAFVAQRVSAVAQAAGRAVSGEPAPEPTPQPTLRLELPDGEVVSAWPVPLPHESEHTLLLTRDGYVVVSAEGRIVHRL